MNSSALLEFDRSTRSISFDGYEFDIQGKSWQLNKNVNVSLDFLTAFESSVRSDVRNVLVYYAEQRSAGYTSRIATVINRYLRLTEQAWFDTTGIVLFRSLLGRQREDEVAVIRIFLKQALVLEYPLTDSACMELIKAWRLYAGDKGVPVLSLCPEHGPFSDFEYEAILSGLDNSYAEGSLSAEQYTVVQLFAATGRRPSQIAGLKCGDLRIDSEILGKPIYVLRIPKAKVRFGHFREFFTDCALLPHIGQVFEVYVAEAQFSIAKAIGRQLTAAEKNALPLFPDFDAIKELAGKIPSEVLSLLEKDVCHGEVTKLRAFLISTIDQLNIVSERTKERLHANPYRFRYTLGTRAARENAGLITIATLLDHVDTQHSKYYIQNHPDHAAKISAIMNSPLSNYADAFKGRIVKGESEAHMVAPGSTRVRADGDSDNIGSCGTNSFCRDYAPVACYLCPKFMPWQDAPHHLILSQLLSERDRILNETGDRTIAAINDRAIIAVAQVIRQCAELGKGVN